MIHPALRLAWLALLLVASSARAHEVRPALLELRELGAQIWDVHWRVPARGDLRLGIHVRLPGGCEDVAPRRASFVAAMHVERWTVRCEAGLAGREVAIDGLSETVTDVIVRVVLAGGETRTTRVMPSDPVFEVMAAPGPFEVARTYLALGVEHILLGVDHLLFVLALLILVEGRRRLVQAITAFTLAHSVTLAAATLGSVRVPPAPVEAVIALSIVFLACEIVRARGGRPGLARGRPWIVAFAFGLLHGFGFAGALAQVGLPANAIPMALLFFNLGVEAGQLVFVAAALAIMAAARPILFFRSDWAWRVPVYGMGVVASYWTLSRIAGFWR